MLQASKKIALTATAPRVSSICTVYQQHRYLHLGLRARMRTLRLAMVGGD